MMTSSNLVGNSTGKSPGLLPFKNLSTYAAARQKLSRRLNSVADQATGDGTFVVGKHSRKPSWGGQIIGHTRIESTVRYLGVEVDDALEIGEKIDCCRALPAALHSR